MPHTVDKLSSPLKKEQKLSLEVGPLEINFVEASRVELNDQQGKTAAPGPPAAAHGSAAKSSLKAAVKFGESMPKAASTSGMLERSPEIPKNPEDEEPPSNSNSGADSPVPDPSRRNSRRVSISTKGSSIRYGHSLQVGSREASLASSAVTMSTTASNQHIPSLPQSAAGSRSSMTRSQQQIFYQAGQRPSLPQSVTQAIRKATLTRRASLASASISGSAKEKEVVQYPVRANDEILIDANEVEEVESETSHNLLAAEVPEGRRDFLPPALSKLLNAFTARWVAAFTNPLANEWNVFDHLTFLLDTWYLLVVPFVSAFFCDQSAKFKVHYLILDCFLIMRVAVNIYRPKMDPHGQLVLDTAAKRAHYFEHMHGWYEMLGSLPVDWIPILMAFWDGSTGADFSCSKPMYYYGDGSTSPVWNATLSVENIRYMYFPDEVPHLLFAYSILRFLRLISTVRTVSWFLRIRIPFTSSPVSRLLKNLLISLYISHMDACMWWILQSTLDPEERWANLSYVVVDHESSTLTGLSMRYAATFYSCQRALFFVPRERTYTAGEYVYQCCEVLMAAIVSGSIIGNLSAVIRLFDRQAALDKAEKTREMQRQFVLQFMVHKSFPVVLQKKVLDQLDFEWIHQRGMDMEHMFAELPRSIFLEVCVHLYYALVSSVPLFDGTDDIFKVAMCERIFVINVCRGFYLCKAGEAGHEMYFVRSGGVEIMTKDETKVLTTLGPNSFFGEIALFQECQRTATARTTEDSELCVLKKEDFDEILNRHPAMIEVFRRTVAERQERDQKRLQDQKAKEDRKDHEDPKEEGAQKPGAMQHLGRRKSGQGLGKMFGLGAKGVGSLATIKGSNVDNLKVDEVRASSSLMSGQPDQPGHLPAESGKGF